MEPIVYVHKENKIYFKESVHMIMQFAESHDLQGKPAEKGNLAILQRLCAGEIPSCRSKGMSLFFYSDLQVNV
jgi:hypothetical protein